MIPISKAMLPVKLRETPYYLDINSYVSHQLHITTIRSLVKKDYRRILYLKQLGLCPSCNLPLKYETLSSTLMNEDSIIDNDELELHHIQPVGLGLKLGPRVHSHFLKLNNITLLHKTCHAEITSK